MTSPAMMAQGDHEEVVNNNSKYQRLVHKECSTISWAGLVGPLVGLDTNPHILHCTVTPVLVGFRPSTFLPLPCSTHQYIIRKEKNGK